MSMSDYAKRSSTPSKILPVRLMSAIWRQKSRTPRCPDEPRLVGKLAVVTGGNAGIGLEISRGLAKRGAEVIVAARNRTTSAAACQAIAAETSTKLHDVPLDLSDLTSVAAATDGIAKVAGGRRVSLIVANAGVWPRDHMTSAQGYEIAFATNTLGHHALVRAMIDRGLLADDARVVVLTGDIYIRQKECTPDFTYDGTGGGALAYSRSKLGNLWFTAELQRRYPRLEVCAVHPGVIDSNLGGAREPTGFGAFMRSKMMLGCEEGAQTPLWCATQPIERGAYYHNTHGRVTHPAGDPAANAEQAAALWDRLEELRSRTVEAAAPAH